MNPNPAIKSLSDAIRPVMVIDTREQMPLVFTRLESVRDSLHSTRSWAGEELPS